MRMRFSKALIPQDNIHASQARYHGEREREGGGGRVDGLCQSQLHAMISTSSYAAGTEGKRNDENKNEGAGKRR